MKIGSLFYRLMPYLLAIVFCLVLGGIASLLQKEALSEWYPFLVKSSLTPPGYVFPIVWGILYVLIGIAFGAVWHAGEKRSMHRCILLTLWSIQCALNFLWSVCFFYGRLPWMGLLVILLLLIVVVFFLFKSLRFSRLAFFCFLPYAIWLALATYLNIYICIYN